MAAGLIVLRMLVSGLADPRAGKKEPKVQSDGNTLLLAAAPQLDDDELRNILLESPVGQRRRIDIEVGTTSTRFKRTS